ncbi:MAG: DUF748 domain-containing protein, partial [Planctomycetota bacterium]
MRSPVRIGATLLQQVRVTLLDETADGWVERELALELRVDDLGYEERNARAEVLALGPGWLDLLLVRAEIAHRDDGGLHIDGTFDLSGLQPDQLAHLLEGSGLEPRARVIDGEGRLEASLTPLDAERPSGPITAVLTLTDVGLEADLERQLGFDALRVDVPEWSAARISHTDIALEGPVARAQRDASGTLNALGFALVPTEPSAAAEETEVPGPEAEPATSGASEPLAIHDASVSIRGGRMIYEDLATPAGVAQVVETDLDELDVQGFCWPITPQSTPTVLHLNGAIDGSLAELALDGTMTPRSGGLAATVKINATGISANASRPYLVAAGLVPILDGGRVDLQLDLDLEREADGQRLNAVARGLAIEDASARLVDLGTLTLDELRFGPSGTTLGRLALEQLSLPIARTPDGALEIAGLRIPSDRPAEPYAFSIEGEQIVLEGLDFSGDADSPAKLVARGGMPGIVETLALDGRIDLDAGSALYAFDLTADGFAPSGIEPLLTDMGLRSELEGGSLSGRIELEQGQRVEGGGLTLKLFDVAYADAGRELFAVDQLSLGPTGGSPLEVGVVALNGARLALDVRADGSLAILGFGPYVPPIETAPPVDASVDLEGFGDPDAGTEPAKTLGGDEAPAANEPRRAPQAPAPEVRNDLGGSVPLPDLLLRGARFDGLQLIVQDERLEDAGRMREVTVTGELQPLRIGPNAEPSRLDLTLALGDDAAFELVADLMIHPDEVRAELALRGEVADGPGLDNLLPPGLGCELRDGRLSADILAELRAGEAGGRAVRLAVNELRIADGDERELLALDSLRLTAPRLDPSARTYAIDELSVAGLVGEVTLGADGSTHAAGLVLGAPAPVDAASATSAPADPAATPAAPSVLGRREIPTEFDDISFTTLDVGIERLRLIDEQQGPDAVPIDLALRLTNDQPWQLLSSDPESLPPLTARLEASAAPLLGPSLLSLTLAPFAEAPRFEAELALMELSGAGLEAALPSSAAGIEAEGLTDGSFEGRLTAELEVRRRHPLDLDFRDGFGANLDLEQVTLVDRVQNE